jgi:hypothetical protein
LEDFSKTFADYSSSYSFVAFWHQLQILPDIEKLFDEKFHISKSLSASYGDQAKGNLRQA